MGFRILLFGSWFQGLKGLHKDNGKKMETTIHRVYLENS